MGPVALPPCFSLRMNIDFKYALGSNSLLATHLRIFSQGQAIVLKMAPLFPFSVEKKKADSLNL